MRIVNVYRHSCSTGTISIPIYCKIVFIRSKHEMHRHLLRLETYPRLGANCLFFVRPFSDSSKIVDDNNSNDTQNESEKKQKKISKSVVVKLKKLDNVVPKKNVMVKPQQQETNKMDSLIKKAQSIKSIGPNEKATLSQSIGKPKNFIRQSARGKIDAPIQDSEPINILTKGLDQRLVEAARRVTSKMPKHIARVTEKELLQSIEKQKKESIEAKKQFEKARLVKEDFTKSISYQIMNENKASQLKSFEEFNNRIASTVEKIKLPPASSIQFASAQKRPSFVGTKYKKDSSLFSGECLNIFDPNVSYLNDADFNRNVLWDTLLREEIEQTVEYPPANAFEEMIKWTKEGKLWKYPINNEQGLEAEEETPFYEHVLLDKLLNDFPKEGPVRQFMELIVMGLSQNPYITVERKHETVKFYKTFFEEKDLLNIHIGGNVTERDSTKDTSL